ncbi:MAG: protein phosphatase 2C domain-containing protein [Chloroflexota bacterium]
MFGNRRHSNIPIIGYRSDDGVRGKRNDDRYDHFVIQNRNAEPFHVLIVADGVTSAEGSAQASEIAVQEVRRYLSEHIDSSSPTRCLTNAITHAHNKILRIAQIYPEWRTMCTTIVVAVVHQNYLYVAHMGDSRAYLIRQNSINLLTRDHTWIQDAIDEGVITKKAAKTHPKRHIVKRFLGIQEKINVDCTIVAPSQNGASSSKFNTIDRIPLRPSDTILLCTDGLTEKVEEQEIHKLIFRSGKRAQKAVDSLIRLALKRKEADNITALLLIMPDR